MISLPIRGVNIVFANAINKHICLDCITKKLYIIYELIVAKVNRMFI